MFFLDIGIKLKQNQQQQQKENNFGFYLLNKSSKGKKAKCSVQLFVSTQMLFSYSLSWFCNVLCLKEFEFFLLMWILLCWVKSWACPDDRCWERWAVCADTEKILSKRTKVWNLREYLFLTCLVVVLLQYRLCASINEIIKLLWGLLAYKA